MSIKLSNSTLFFAGLITFIVGLPDHMDSFDRVLVYVGLIAMLIATQEDDEDEDEDEDEDSEDHEGRGTTIKS